MDTPSITSSRRYYLDWLRVFAIYMLIPLHAAMVFSPVPFFHIRNSTVSSSMLALFTFGGPWFIPLAFVVAGWVLFYSLRARGGGAFLKERFLRLFIPLVVGCVLLGPPIKYLELRSGFDVNYLSRCASNSQAYPFGPCIPASSTDASSFNQGFLEFWPTFFTNFGRVTWSHLWFLGYLFVFSVLYFPLFWWLTKSRYNLVRAGATWVYLPMLPLLLIEITLRPRWPGIQNLHNDWANFAYFSTCLIAGFLLARYPALEQTLRQERKRALGVSLLGMALRVPLAVGMAVPPILSSASLVLASWGTIIALLGVAQVRLAHTNAVLDYLKGSVYPVYFLHQLAVVGIGYRIIQLPLGIAAKYALLLSAALITTLAIYEFVIRRVFAPRLALSIKPGRRKAGPGQKET